MDDEEDKFYARDRRPLRGHWAPGHYMNECLFCQKNFIGDKLARECAECAYSDARAYP